MDIKKLQERLNLLMNFNFSSEEEEIDQQLTLKEGTLANELYKKIKEGASEDELSDLIGIYNQYANSIDGIQVLEWYIHKNLWREVEFADVDRFEIDENDDPEDQLSTIEGNSRRANK